MCVTVTQNLLPKIERIPVLKTREILEHAAHGNVARADHTETAGQVGNSAASRQLFAQDMDGNWQLATLTVFVRIPHQLDEAEGQKQTCQKIKGAVLVAGYEEVGAQLLAGQLQIDFVSGGDFLDQFRLEHLKAGAQANDNTTSHSVAGLLK